MSEVERSLLVFERDERAMRCWVAERRDSRRVEVECLVVWDLVGGIRRFGGAGAGAESERCLLEEWVD